MGNTFKMPDILANIQQFNIVLIFAFDMIPFDFSVYSAKRSLASPVDLEICQIFSDSWMQCSSEECSTGSKDTSSAHSVMPDSG